VKPRSLIIYFLVFIILGLFFYVYDVRFAKKEAEFEKSEKKIFNLDFNKINGLVYKNKDQEIQLVREKPEEWKITQPVETPADRWAVESVVRGLLDAEKEQVFENVKDMGQYGLDQPQLKVTFMDKGRPIGPTLYVGDTEPAGYLSYARLGESSEVFTVISTVRYDMAKTLFELRDKSVVLLPGEKINRIIIEQDDSMVELERRGIRRWDVVRPEQTPADDDLVQKIVYSALKSQVTALVEPNQLPADNNDELGFETPGVKVTVFAEEKDPVKLIIGQARKQPEASAEKPNPPKQDSGYWATSDERSEVLVITSDAVKALQTDFEQIRDKRILGRRDLRTLSKILVRRGEQVFKAEKVDDIWDITSPPEPTSQDRQVENFLGNLASIRFEKTVPVDEAVLTEYGLDAPEAVIELVSPQETTKVNLNLQSRDDGFMAVRVDEGPVALVKRDDVFNNLPVEVEAVIGKKE
jgi:hypothetical protein